MPTFEVGPGGTVLWKVRIFASAMLASVAGLAFSADHGRTTGAFDVSNGAATYTVPIWGPPGPAGVQPSIALSYSSQAQNGVAGVGWSISGIPSIARCPRTIHQDTTPSAIDYTGNDRLCINGNRLRLASGTYGQSGSVYFTEIADFSRISALSAPDGQLYFRVEAKSGMKFDFGYSFNSRTYANGVIHAWLLQKAYDRNSNNYVITYTTSGGTPLPSVIHWTPTSHQATTYQYAMSFHYEMTRIDADSIFSGANGVILLNKGLLKNVVISSSGSVVRNYELSHTPSSATSRSLLTSVRECADFGTPPVNCFSALTFSYQPGIAGLTPGVGTVPPAATVGRFDFNGDGKHDVLHNSGGVRWVSLGGANGFSAPFNTGIPTSNTIISVGRFLPNGRDAILARISGTLWTYRWDEGVGAFVGQSTGISLGTTPIGTPVDFTGDGLDDLITINTAGTALQIRHNLSSGTAFPAFASSVSPTATLPTGWRYASIYTYSGTGLEGPDLNGDGREDLYAGVLWPGDFPPTGFDQNAFAMIASSGGYVVPPTSQWTTGVLGTFKALNFDGDACTDTLLNSTVYISACNGAYASTKTVPAAPLLLLDWDADGRTDFLVNNGGTLGVYRSTGNGFGSLIATSIPSSGSLSSPDLDGDGLDDLVSTAASSTAYWTHTPGGFVPAHATNIPDLLSSVSDGFGVSHTANYTFSAWSHYSQGTPTSFPLQEGRSRLLVAKSTSSDGIGSTYDRTYHYLGLRTHATRRESAGFQRIDETDSRNGLISRVYFEQQFPLIGRVLQSEVMQPNGVTPITRLVNANTSTAIDTSANNQRHFAFTSGSTRTQYEVGSLSGALLSTITTANLFETVGGTLYDRTVTTTEPASGANGISAGGSWTRRTYLPTANIVNDTANWCMGRAGRVEQHASHNLTYGSPSTRISTISWDQPKCRQTLVVDEPNHATLELATSFGYDSFGNINSTTVTGAGIASRTTSAAYSDSQSTTGQFPLSVTNALSQTTSTVWNYSLGVPSSQTDPNGLTTTWQYDAFGRRTRETRPDGTATGWSINNCASVTGGCVGSNNKTIVIATEYTNLGGYINDGWAYLDAFDRPIVETTRVLGGFYNRIDREFDSLGRLYRESAPCVWASCSWRWFTHQYDLANRLTVVSRPVSDSNPTLQYTTTHYEGLTTRTVDAQNKQSAVIVNSVGELVRSVDHDNYYQSFDYDAFGSLKRVQDGGGVLQSSSYNARGMLTARVDMDLGTWSFTPNALGEVVSQTDAKGQTTTFQFDLLGRLTQRAEPEGPSTWTWGASSAAKNIGKLSGISGPGYAESYTYTPFSQLVSRVISAGGKTYQYNYSYNIQGKLNVLTYPISTAGYRLRTKFDYRYGHVYRISDFDTPSTVFWVANSSNASNQITQETLGNGLVTNRAYDEVTGWLESIQTGPGGGAGVQDLSYTWDLVGNLKTREDPNLTEEFFYDNLYRLDYSTLTGVSGANLDLSYDPLGNITSKSDVGAYTYHPTRRHQVTSTSNGWTFGYDNNGNMTSGRGASITWTSFNYPSSITSGPNTASFSYTPDREYWQQVSNYTSGGSATTVYAGGLLEKVTTSAGTDFRYMIPTGSSTVIVSRQSTGTNSVHYVTSDHLGSASTITNAAGAVLVNLNFDAFGKRRGAGWAGSPSSSDWAVIAGTTRRGYTEHSMLDNLGLIHMNGRGYDPYVGRFMSADPFVAEIERTQNHNRYSYVENNPLTYTDPTGFVKDGVPSIRPMEDVSGTTMNCWGNGSACSNTWRSGVSQDESIWAASGRVFGNMGVTLANYFGEMGKDTARFYDEYWTQPFVRVVTGNRDKEDAGKLTLASGAILLEVGGLKRVLTAAKGVNELARAARGGLVIGRGADLAKPGALRPGEYLLKWDSKLPNFKAEWHENAGRLREAMRQGKPIRDASVGNTGGIFLNAERALLKERGWTFNSPSGYWMPPGS